MLDVSRDRLIPAREVCAMLDLSRPALEAACDRHGVPWTRLSRSKQGLMASDLQILIQRAKEPAHG